ncbi:hypothetical protein Hanom_Chr14g01252791 [Helianthus anomalus]
MYVVSAESSSPISHLSPHEHLSIYFRRAYLKHNVDYLVVLLNMHFCVFAFCTH